MTEELKPLYDKKVKCPICSVSYTTKRIRSRFIRVEKMESDFFSHYKDKHLNPILYEVNVCPKCGYAFADTFSNYFPPNSIDLIKMQIMANWKERDFSEERSLQQAIDSYKLAILSGSLKEEKSVVMAGLCLRLAWLYRLVSDQHQELRFLEFALNKYKNSYNETDYVGTHLTEIRILYLIGELSRRLGDRHEAVKNFSKVINHKSRSLENKIVEMAREQWYLIRENDQTAE